MDGELGKDGKRGRDKELAHIATQHDEVQEIRPHASSAFWSTTNQWSASAGDDPRLLAIAVARDRPRTSLSESGSMGLLAFESAGVKRSSSSQFPSA